MEDISDLRVGQELFRQWMAGQDEHRSNDLIGEALDEGFATDEAAGSADDDLHRESESVVSEEISCTAQGN